MPTDTNRRTIRTWGGLRKALPGGGGRRSVTVMFNYGGSLRTVVASSFRAAVLEAVARWGND
jgi:hypothetical protein